MISDKFKQSKTTKIIKIFSNDAAGVVTGKIDSLRSEVKATEANIVNIHETHSTRKGKIVMPKEFVVFKAIRPS